MASIFVTEQKNCRTQKKNNKKAPPRIIDSTFVLMRLLRGMRERSPPLAKIARPSLPHLGRSQASTRQGAMHESPPGGTACLITVSSAPGKLSSDRPHLLIITTNTHMNYGTALDNNIHSLTLITRGLWGEPEKAESKRLNQAKLKMLGLHIQCTRNNRHDMQLLTVTQVEHNIVCRTPDQGCQGCYNK